MNAYNSTTCLFYNLSNDALDFDQVTKVRLFKRIKIIQNSKKILAPSIFSAQVETHKTCFSLSLSQVIIV